MYSYLQPQALQFLNSKRTLPMIGASESSRVLLNSDNACPHGPGSPSPSVVGALDGPFVSRNKASGFKTSTQCSAPVPCWSIGLVALVDRGSESTSQESRRHHKMTSLLSSGLGGYISYPEKPSRTSSEHARFKLEGQGRFAIHLLLRTTLLTSPYTKLA